MASIIATSISNQTAFNEAIRTAEMRSYHTFYSTHVVEQHDGSYYTVEEADYDTIPMHIIDRITFTAPGRLADEY